MAFKVTNLRFEHFKSAHQLGCRTRTPRLSWKFENAPPGFVQHGYTVQLYDRPITGSNPVVHEVTVESDLSVLVPWPSSEPLKSRQRIFARVKAWGQEKEVAEWSDAASIEVGLLRKDWEAKRISGGDDYVNDSPQTEELFRREFRLQQKQVVKARLHITCYGVYQAEINGEAVGDHFLAPGWTVYDRRLPYQTFDVSDLVTQQSGHGVLGVRLAEGWCCGRIGFEGGRRGYWADRPSLLAQLEVSYDDGTVDVIITDDSWTSTRGPTVQAEIYDGEKYDACLEVSDWSSVSADTPNQPWQAVKVVEPLPSEVDLYAQDAEPVRRLEIIRPVQKIVTPSGKTILDFGQNLVGVTRLKGVIGSKGHTLTLSHAEVLEHGELGRRPLRQADNTDTYTLKGSETPESWEPRFTFHGYRYVQVDGWIEERNRDILESFEAVVCHTDMQRVGDFNCSNTLLNRLYQNVIWSTRGNFLSIPMDCPQRDERLGWTGDIAVFAKTASIIFDPVNMLQSWCEDVAADQGKFGGIVPPVVPFCLRGDPMFGNPMPCALWSDAIILVPWALYEATGDAEILRSHFKDMVYWLAAIPLNKGSNVHLWDDTVPQLGDWLDPSAPAERPNLSKTDAVLVANAYLIRSLEVIVEAAKIIGRQEEADKYKHWHLKAKEEFISEYVTPTGRLMSDSQTAYALALAFDLFPSEKQRTRAADRLTYIVRQDSFQIGTGFAGTPTICDALAQAGRPNIAYSMLLNKECPSWLYAVTKGATTVWERWDSMLPDGTINPGSMTSFNHYAFGAVASFLVERVAGLQIASPGWKKIRVAPVVGGNLTHASASVNTPYGEVSSSWRLDEAPDGTQTLHMEVVVPPNTSCEVVFPEGTDEKPVNLRSGSFQYSMLFQQKYKWPVEAIRKW